MRYEDQFGSLTQIGTKTTDKAQLLFSPKLLLESANNNRHNCYKVTAGDQFLARISRLMGVPGLTIFFTLILSLTILLIR